MLSDLTTGMIPNGVTCRKGKKKQKKKFMQLTPIDLDRAQPGWFLLLKDSNYLV